MGEEMCDKVAMVIRGSELMDLIDEFGPLSLDIITDIIQICVRDREPMVPPVLPLMILAEVIEYNLSANTPQVENHGWGEIRETIKAAVTIHLNACEVTSTKVIDPPVRH